jgi:hypothetical protein
MVLFAGLRIEPEVSVPTLAAARFADVAMPELEPPVRLELPILALNPESGNVAARPASDLR